MQSKMQLFGDETKDEESDEAPWYKVNVTDPKNRSSYVFSGSFNGSYFNTNYLPYISQSRSLFFILCTICFLTAPAVYMPLASIQKAFHEKCFFYSDIHLKNFLIMHEQHQESICCMLDAAKTHWSYTSFCNYLTFAPVAVAIVSIMIGWSTITIWPTMMEVGMGDKLMAVYMLLIAACIAVCCTSAVFMDEGYKVACDSFNHTRHFSKEKMITCEDLDNAVVIIKEVANNYLVQNIHYALVVARMFGWVLVSETSVMFLLGAFTYGNIWYHLKLDVNKISIVSS